MAQVGDSARTPHGPGKITEIDKVRGRGTIYRVAGRGFNAWVDEARCHTAGEEENLFSYGPMMAEQARWEHQPHIYEGGLDSTIEPNGHVNENNSTILPWTANGHQNPDDMFRRDLSWGPGEYTLDKDERLHPSHSLSGESASSNRPYPGPNPDLFAKHSAHDRGAPTPHQSGPHGLDHDAPELREHAHPSMRDEEDEDHDHMASNRYAEFEDEPCSPPWGEDEWHEGLPDGPDRTFDAAVRPAGLSNRYAFIPEEIDHRDPITAFRRDPVAFIRQCGHLWTDGDDSLDYKYADYTQLIDVDPMMRQAAWTDVRQKAMRLRHEGKVQVNDHGAGRIHATVEGDHGTYDTMIVKGGSYGGLGGGQSVTDWACSCEWGRWAFKRQMSYVGRLCSHGYATYLEMQAKDIGPENFKKKVAAHDLTNVSTDGLKNWLKNHQDALDMGVNVGQVDHDKAKQFRAEIHHRQGSYHEAAIVDDYKSWLEDNNQNPEPASVASFLHSTGQDSSTSQAHEDADKLYDYISENPAMVPERNFDIDYTHDLDKAYKSASPNASGHYGPGDYAGNGPASAWNDDPDHEYKSQDEIDAQERPTHGRDFDSLLDRHSPDDEGYDSLIDGRDSDDDHLFHHADLLRNRPESMSPNLRMVPKGGQEWMDLTKDERETTGPDEIQHFSSIMRSLHGGWGDAESEGAASTSGTESNAHAVDNPMVGDSMNIAGSNRYAEDCDHRPDASEAAGMLDEMRDLSRDGADDHYQSMAEHNDHVSDLVEDLHDAGVYASPMVASRYAKEDPNDGNGSLEGTSNPTWLDAPFAGSGPNPKHYISDSAGYVAENREPYYQDVTDAEGDIIKFNDSRSAPQQGPGHTGAAEKPDEWWSAGDHAEAEGHWGDQLSGEHDKEYRRKKHQPAQDEWNKYHASLHYAGGDDGYFNPNNRDDEAWDAGSGDQFIDDVQNTLPSAPSMPGSPAKGEAGGEAAAAGGEAAGGGELAELALLAASRRSPDGGSRTRRAGGGPRQAVRIDPGVRGQQQRRAAAPPPEDFGYDGGIDKEAYLNVDESTDIVAAFQRNANASALNEPTRTDSDIASSPHVQAMLRTAGRKYSPEEQRELEAEFHPQGARNLPTDDDLAGTHYLLGI